MAPVHNPVNWCFLVYFSRGSSSRRFRFMTVLGLTDPGYIRFPVRFTSFLESGDVDFFKPRQTSDDDEEEKKIAIWIKHQMAKQADPVKKEILASIEKGWADDAWIAAVLDD